MTKHKKSPGKLFVIAGFLTGMGFGLLTDQVAAGIFIGLGIGFIFFALYRVLEK